MKLSDILEAYEFDIVDNPKDDSKGLSTNGIEVEEIDFNKIKRVLFKKYPNKKQEISKMSNSELFKYAPSIK